MFKFFLPLLSVGLLMTAPVNAAISFIQDASSFNAPQTENFSGLANGPVSESTILAALGINSIEIDIDPGSTDTLNAATVSPPSLGAGIDGVLSLLGNQAGVATNSFTFSFTGLQDRLLFDLGDMEFVTDAYSIDLLVAGAVIDSINFGFGDFTDSGVLGVISTIQFDGLRIRARSRASSTPFVVDSVTVDSVAEVPLPAAFWFLGLGIVGLRAAARTKKFGNTSLVVVKRPIGGDRLGF